MYFRVALHTHSYWSDGQAFPEEIAFKYRKKGFHAVALTDHNIFSDDPAFYLQLQEEAGDWPYSVTYRAVEENKARFGNFAEGIKQVSFRNFVRLKTFREVQNLVEEPGKFILIPGEEFTTGIQEEDCYREIHMNVLNIPQNLPLVTSHSVSSTIEANFRTSLRNAAEEKFFFMLNHPLWRCYDIAPEDLLAVPEVRHVEICNCAEVYPITEDFYPYIQFWDVVNANRIANGLGPVYGAASDDSHSYQEGAADDVSCYGYRYVMVRASELTAENIIESLNRGDYYASSGVELDEISFDPEQRSLRVKVAAEPNCKYQIRFVYTPKDFPRETEYVEIPADPPRPSRKIGKYSPEIGKTAAVFEGTEAKFTAPDDALYLRCEVISDKPFPLAGLNGSPCNYCSCWTQVFPCVTLE